MTLISLTLLLPVGYFQWTLTLIVLTYDFFLSVCISYFVVSPRKLSITMPGYIDSMLEKYGVKRVQSILPSNNDLFLRDENSPERKEFHSRVNMSSQSLQILSELCTCTVTWSTFCSTWTAAVLEESESRRIAFRSIVLTNMRGHAARLISISKNGNGGTIQCESSK